MSRPGRAALSLRAAGHRAATVTGTVGPLCSVAGAPATRSAAPRMNAHREDLPVIVSAAAAITEYPEMAPGREGVHKGQPARTAAMLAAAHTPRPAHPSQHGRRAK